MGAQAPPSIPPGTDLWKTPAGKPPPGVVPNFVDPVTNKNIPQVTLSILVIIATMFVALRVFVQFYLAKHKWGWDDGKWAQRKYRCSELTHVYQRLSSLHWLINPVVLDDTKPTDHYDSHFKSHTLASSSGVSTAL